MTDPLNPADVEAPMRAAIMQALNPWFDVAEEVPVELKGGLSGRVDVLARPKDSRFSQFSFAVEAKCARKMTDRLSARIRQAADYIGSKDKRTGTQITMVFLDLTSFDITHSKDRDQCRLMMQVAHQFFVGGLYNYNGSLWLRCGPDTIWRERPFADTGEQWPGRTLERLTNTRQSAGVRRHAA